VLIARRMKDGSEGPARAALKLGNNEQMTLDALDAALADKAREIPAAHDVPRGMRGIPTEEWEESALRYLPQKPDWRKKQTFE
jgi:hypothetical protein